MSNVRRARDIDITTGREYTLQPFHRRERSRVARNQFGTRIASLDAIRDNYTERQDRSIRGSSTAFEALEGLRNVFVDRNRRRLADWEKTSSEKDDTKRQKLDTNLVKDRVENNDSGPIKGELHVAAVPVESLLQKPLKRNNKPYKYNFIGDLEITDSPYSFCEPTISEIFLINSENKLWKWSFQQNKPEASEISFDGEIIATTSSQLMFTVVFGRHARRFIDSSLKSDIEANCVQLFEDSKPETLPHQVVSKLNHLRSNMLYSYVITKTGQLWTWGIFTEKFKEKTGMPYSRSFESKSTCDESIIQPKKLEIGCLVNLKRDVDEMKAKDRNSCIKYKKGTKFIKGSGNSSLGIYEFNENVFHKDEVAFVKMTKDLLDSKNPYIGCLTEITIKSDIIIIDTPKDEERPIQSPPKQLKKGKIIGQNKSMNMLAVDFNGNVEILKESECVAVESQDKNTIDVTNLELSKVLRMISYIFSVI